VLQIRKLVCNVHDGGHRGKLWMIPQFRTLSMMCTGGPACRSNKSVLHVGFANPCLTIRKGKIRERHKSGGQVRVEVGTSTQSHFESAGKSGWHVGYNLVRKHVLACRYVKPVLGIGNPSPQSSKDKS
jgi:hypothetical protein